MEDYSSEDEQQEVEENQLINFMPEVYENISKFYSHIDTLWDEVFVPYIENSNQHQVLTKLSVNDKHKFVHFMMKHCEPYHKLCIINKHAERIYPVIEDVSSKKQRIDEFNN